MKTVKNKGMVFELNMIKHIFAMQNNKTDSNSMKTMKKLSIIALLFVMGVSVAQETTTPTILTDYQAFSTRLKKSDADIENPKKNVKAKTFIKRAELMMDIADIYAMITPGSLPFTIKSLLGDANSVETVTTNGVAQEKHIYDMVEVIYEGGAVVSHNDIAPLYDNPLSEALKSLKKAEELDIEKKEDKAIEKAYDELKQLLQKNAIGDIRDENYKAALSGLENYIVIDKMERFQAAVDTPIYYFAAFSAYSTEKYDKVIKYGEVVRKYNYPEAYNYFILTRAYYENNDSTEALNVLKEGFNAFPDNQYLVNELINYYLLREQAESALEYIQIAKQGDPENPSYYFAEGTLYDKLEKYDEAILSYEEAFKIDPSFYNAYFNLSVLYYNLAVKVYNEAANELDNAKYEAMKKEAEDLVEKAIPPMEKAHELNPDDLSTLENLKTYYYRLRLKSDDYKTKWEEVKAKLEE
jgi:tetratricopeptide (TPR) repeat protein